MCGQDTGHEGIHHKALGSEIDRLGGSLSKADRAITLQCTDPGAGCGGHHRAQYPFGDLSIIFALEQIGRHSGRPGAEAADGLDAACLNAIDHDRRHAGNIHIFAMHHTENEAACDAGIDGISARFQYF